MDMSLRPSVSHAALFAFSVGVPTHMDIRTMLKIYNKLQSFIPFFIENPLAEFRILSAPPCHSLCPYSPSQPYASVREPHSHDLS